MVCMTIELVCSDPIIFSTMKLFVGLGVLLLVVGAYGGASMHNPFYCYATDTIRSMTNMASTITSYEAIRRFNFTTVSPYRSTCTPSRFWYLGRYGSRLPHAIMMQQMIDFAESSVQANIVRNYEAGRTTLCRQDFEAIRNFTMETEFPGFHLANASLVTDSGLLANENIARRFQENFPSILPNSYSPERFLFRHTNSVRTNQSTRAFATGLFGEEGAQNVVYEDVPEIDWLLRPFDFCPAFDDEVVSVAWDQQNSFREGPEVQEMVEQVNRRLGFISDQLNFDQIFSMWNWCRFQLAATFEESNSETGPDSPWCAAFSVAHHLILEYFDDLFHFYFSGYGVRNQRLLENLNCGAMQDLINHMQSDSEQSARVYMSYTQEVQLMLVLLGSFRDTWPLHQHNFAQQSSRNWLTSLIAPFGSNLAVVRHDCDDGDHDLIFYLNERPILVPGCDQQNGVCKLSVLEQRFQRFIGVDCGQVFCSMI